MSATVFALPGAARDPVQQANRRGPYLRGAAIPIAHAKLRRAALDASPLSNPLLDAAGQLRRLLGAAQRKRRALSFALSCLPACPQCGLTESGKESPLREARAVLAEEALICHAAAVSLALVLADHADGGR